MTGGRVGRAGCWAVVNRGGTVTAVSPRCRHQLADLSRGTLDANGCLVCPWHGSRYDVDSGAMVQGLRGLLWHVGRTPGYTQLVQAYGAVLALRRHAVAVVGDRLLVKG